MKSQISTPCVGPWYYVFLRPKWKLFANPGSEADWLGHPQFWKHLAVEVIGPHYGIKAPKKIAVLSELCYSMPRGRCSKLIRRASAQPAWAFHYGGDFPNRLKPAAEKKKLIRAFGLTDQASSGHVQFKIDEHERTQDEDRRALELILCAIPY